ncbi:MAG TPA: MBL fold metallo-hydrolase [Planctomycetota bacterium]|nr:MBL fold metallo-hydrolase [Planctomycetota bacterium]
MKLTLEFLGSGTSVGVPVIGCECAVCQSSDSLNKRLRSSVLIRAWDDAGALQTTVLIDTSPDFRQQMLRAKVKQLDAVIISHYHADHVVGIDDVRRFNHMQNRAIDCWARPETLASLKQSFGYVFVEDNNVRWGLPCLTPRPFAFGEAFTIGALRFEPFVLDHQVMLNTGLRISCGSGPALAYCLDVKRIPDESFAKLQCSHTLILDMLREKSHPTHMNLEEALAAVARVNPQRAFFAHIAHEVDHRTLEAKLPQHIRLAYDGLVIEL